MCQFLQTISCYLNIQLKNQNDKNDLIRMLNNFVKLEEHYNMCLDTGSLVESNPSFRY